MKDLKDMLKSRCKAFSYYNQVCGHDFNIQRVLKLLRRVTKGFIFVQAKKNE